MANYIVPWPLLSSVRRAGPREVSAVQERELELDATG